jgi:hypothetical protein
MPTLYNIYCDESCHLEHDGQKAMVLGAIWCPEARANEMSKHIRAIKEQCSLDRFFEIKWTKVSPARLDFYLRLVDYFFEEADLYFRALIVPDKTVLEHDKFGQDHDTWYFKMYFDMLKVILSPDACYRIYLDIKDTKSAVKVRKLHEVLCNNMYDFDRQIIERVQNVRSHEIELLQLADLMIGAVSYVNRGLTTSQAKSTIINRIKEKSHYSLTLSTLLSERKVNIFRWHGAGQ